MASKDPEDERWAFDLLSPVLARRRAALSRHRGLLREAASARTRMNAIWAEAGTPVPPERDLAAAMADAQAAFDAARGGTLFEPVDLFLTQSNPAASHRSERAGRFAVLFLQWERWFPAEWAEAGGWTWSHWGTKEQVLRRMAVAGMPAGVRGDVVELVVAAVAGPYRCKDWRYAPLARLLDGPRLRATLPALAGGAGRPAAMRARFVLHVMDHPGVAITRRTWRRWLATQPGGAAVAGTRCVPASD